MEDIAGRKDYNNKGREGKKHTEGGSIQKIERKYAYLIYN